jgi:hypothetical protein
LPSTWAVMSDSGTFPWVMRAALDWTSPGLAAATRGILQLFNPKNKITIIIRHKSDLI